MSIRRLVPLVAVSLVVLGTALLPGAQSPSPAPAESQLMLVNFARVHPGMAREYTDLQIKEVMPAQRKGGGLGRVAYSSGIGGPPGEFVFVTPIKSFAQFDGPNAMTRALGEDGAAALTAKMAKLAQPMGTSVIRTRPDLSYVPDANAPPAALAVTTVVDVMPGKRIEFEAFIKRDVVPAMRQGKAKSYRVSEVIYGEHTGGYVTLVGYDSYEAIGKGHPFVIALGEEGSRKLEAKAAGLVTKLQRFVVRHRPELSWMPGTGTH